MTAAGGVGARTYRRRVAAEVRAEMARKQITVSALSESTGIPNAALSRRLNAYSPFNVDQLGLIADSLHVPITAFLPPLLTEQVSA